MHTEETGFEGLDSLLQRWTHQNTLTAPQSETIRLAARSISPVIQAEAMSVPQWNQMFAVLNTALLRSLQTCRESHDRAFHQISGAGFAWSQYPAA